MPRKTSLFHLSILIFLMAPSGIIGQVKKPVKWSYAARKISECKYELHMTATLEKGWHIYSKITPEGGAIPTSFTFIKNPLATPNGMVKEFGEMETHFEKLFGVEVKQFSNQVDFVQMFTVKCNVKTNINGKVEFVPCNGKECLMPQENNFSIALQ